MTYFTCLNCAPHSTIDHGNHGKGACLMPSCLCAKMKNGDEFVKPPRVFLSYADAIKAAAK